MKKYEISQELRKPCDHCNSEGYTPFFFPIENQEVMIITAVPSMQAMYKPLTSIRFFRKLCIALFGDKYLGEDYIKEFCGGNIYWTHYYKCYKPACNDYGALPNDCEKRYLTREIKALKPKLIIVFGKEIEKKLKNKIAHNSNAKVIFKPFPETGAENEYNDLKSVMKPYIKFMSKDSTDNFLTNKYSYDVDNSSVKHTVHLKFELNAFIHHINNSSLLDITNIEELWYQKLLRPNMEMYQNVVLTYSFVENQIKTFLQDMIIRDNDYTILESLRNAASAKHPKQKDAQEAVQKYWLSELCSITKFKKYEYTDTAQKLKTLILQLGKIRNIIVHANGFISPAKSDEVDVSQLNGIFVFVNTIYVSKETNKTLEGIAKETVWLLGKIE